MKQYNDFKEYMEEKYYNELYDCVKRYVCRNKDSYEDEKILRVRWADLEEISVSGVSFKEIKNDELEIRVTIDATVDVEGKARYGGYDHFDIYRCCCVFINAILKNGLKDMRIMRVDEYSPNQYDRDRSLSQNLVPYMYEEDVEKHAEAFLKAHYSKALLQPMALPVEEVATGMGMSIYFAPMDETIFGKTYFGEELVTVYDSLAKKSKYEIITKPGTMLVNPDVFFMYNIGTVRNTIIHECVHWDRHRRPFELQKLLQGECTHISCEIVAEEYNGMSQDASALKWMEWQASQLAPRILMPKQMTQKAIFHILKRKHETEPNKRNAVILEEAIEELAVYFDVSKLAAKLRTLEIGYEQAEGTQVFCDGKYLPPYSFKDGSILMGQTFLIDEQNFIVNVAVNSTLRNMYSKGIIVYANCMVCLNSPKYIKKNDLGKNILTDYALDHVDECCFVFERKISASDSFADTYYRQCFLCREVDSSSYIEASYDENHKINQKAEDMQKEIDAIMKQINQVADKMSNEVPSGFSGALKYHMGRKSITVEELSLRTGISTVSISGYRNRVEQNIEPSTALALCKGLCLEENYAFDFMKKSGYDVNLPMPSRIFAKYLITDHMDDTWEQWIDKIEMAHLAKELLPKNRKMLQTQA